VNLVDVFNAMEKDGGSLPDAKHNDAVKKYFEKAYPEMDFERVYSSDMKKMVKWFGVLKGQGVEFKLSEVSEEAGEEKHAEKKPKKIIDKPADKPMRNAPARKATHNRKVGE